jgi:hypothetical protein
VVPGLLGTDEMEHGKGAPAPQGPDAAIESEAEIGLAAARDCPVLITGDVELARILARTIHDASIRRTGPFIVTDCRQDRSILSAATQAMHGTLFLHHADSLSATIQGEVMQLLANDDTTEPRRRPRIMAGDSGRLFGRVGEGTFDQRLFYRLNVIHVWLSDVHTSLRERIDMPESAPPPPDARLDIPKKLAVSLDRPRLGRHQPSGLLPMPASDTSRTSRATRARRRAPLRIETFEPTGD